MADTESYKLVTLPQVKSLLEEDEKRGELSYEKKLALDHAKTFSKISKTNAEKVMKELLALEKYKDKMNEAIALKISEHLPRTPSELRPFFAKERVTLDKEATEEILAVVKKYNE